MEKHLLIQIIVIDIAQENWFRTTAGVKQGRLVSPTLFNIFLKRNMSDALEEYDGKASISLRTITNLGPVFQN